VGAETTVEEKNLEPFPFTVASFYSWKHIEAYEELPHIFQLFKLRAPP
jgi:hypothetical protein